MSKLNWKLLTKKRGSSTQGLPPGKKISLGLPIRSRSFTANAMPSSSIRFCLSNTPRSCWIGSPTAKSNNHLHHPCPR